MSIPDSIEGQGDVKYHLGASGVRRTSSGKEITVSVAFNPSHLEAVNPVVEGLTRPKQDRLGDAKRERVIPLLIHGDAAMAGQGIVARDAESLAGRRLRHRRHHSPGDQQSDRIHDQSRARALDRRIAPMSR